MRLIYSKVTLLQKPNEPKQMGFSLYKAEQPLQGMELQEKEV